MPRGRPPKIHQTSTNPVVVEIPKRPVGRPNTFEPWMCDMLIDTFAQGQFVASFCVKVGIAERTFYRWVQDHPELAEAYEDAKTACKAFYETHLAAQAVSNDKSPNFNQLAMILNNRFSEDYKRNAAGDSGNTTHIQNLNVLNLEKLSDEELNNRIQQLIQSNPQLVEHSTDGQTTIDGTYTVVTGEAEKGQI